MSTIAPTAALRHDAPDATRFDASPAILADLMIAATLGPGGGLVSLDPDGDSALLSLRRGNETIARVTVPADVAAAAIGRLARMTGLDPLARRGSLTETRAARLSVRLASDSAEVLVTMGATALGMSAELRLLTLQGKEIERRRFAQLKRCVSCDAYHPAARQRCDADGGALREVWDDPKPGGTIGSYCVRSRIGEGATGQVFAAAHALIEREVAIKVLRPHAAMDHSFEARFLLEARATSRLRHPNIVEVTDYGVLASGSPFIVMERLGGESLQQLLARTGALDPRVALRIARQIALGLAAAHDGGVVHNDLKPSNVILLGDATDVAPRLKLIDFGAASLGGADADDEIIVGTPAYMAPERICGEPSDARSDVYSLGVTLFQMLGGEQLFPSTDSRDVFVAHVTRAPKPASSPFGALPGRVVHLVARALEKKPSERYQTMSEMLVDLEHALVALDAPSWRKWLP